MTNDSCLRRSGSKTASVQDHVNKIAADLVAIDARAKTAGLTVYLMEELGDARLRCEELVRYVAEATKLIEKSNHRDHFFEVAGHLIQGVPEALFKLQKALQAVSLAASRMDYEELKQELRPEKVDELEQVLKDIRIRHVQRRSDPIRPWEQTMIDDMWKSPEAQSAKTAAEPWKATELKEMQDLLKARGYDPKDAKKLQNDGMGPYELEHRLKTTKPGEMGSLEFTHNLKKKASGDEKESRFEEGKPADPTENMSPEDAKKWKEEHAKNKDNFKAASVPVDRLKGAVESIERACKDIKHHLGKGEKTPMSDVLTLFNDIRGTSSTMVRRLDKNASENAYKFAAELPMDVAGDFQAASLALKTSARGTNVKKNTCIAVHLIASAVGKLKEDRSSEALFRAYDIMHASGMWDLKEPLETRLASDDDKRSRFEEGKPADPTENMSPEDAKRWKEEHAKNKDNFKSARTTAPKLAAKLEKLANDLYDLRAEVRWSADEVQELLEDAAGLIYSGAYANPRVKTVRDELRAADNAMGAAARGSEYLVRVLKGQRSLEASKEACGEPMAQHQQRGCGDPKANEDLYGQIKPGCGVTIVTPHGQQVTGTAIARGPAGWVLNVKGRPGIAHRENVLKVAGNDEKESRFEEGKPADPTENMSPEDAKKWKEEHAKNKDNFKAAARIVPLHEAKKGDMVEIEVGTPWPGRSSQKEKVTGKVVRVLKDGGLTVDVERTRDNPGGHSNEDVSYVEVAPPKKSASADEWKAASDKKHRFPEGTFTEKEWVERFADRLEEKKVDWRTLMDRRKWNRMDGDEQKTYEDQLKKKAEKPVFRAWKGDTYQDISKDTYLWARQQGIGKKSAALEWKTDDAR